MTRWTLNPPDERLTVIAGRLMLLPVIVALVLLGRALIL